VVTVESFAFYAIRFESSKLYRSMRNSFTPAQFLASYCLVELC